MAVAWLLFPLVMVAACLGCGLTVERLGGWQLPGTLLPSVGLGLVIILADLTTESSAIAPLTTVLVVILAIVGYATSWTRVRSLRPEIWPLAAALAVFAVYAAPVVASGQPTFLGYSIDGDPAIHFGLTSQLLSHGHDLSGLAKFPNSSVYNLMRSYLNTSYPVGADLGAGALRPLVGQNLAWIFQPYLAVVLAFGAAAIFELLRDVVRSPPL